jgi:hypothetical protein
VEGVRHREALRAYPLGGESLGDRQHIRGAPGDHAARWTIDGGKRDLRVARNRGLHLRLIGRNRHHRPVLRQGSHQPPTGCHQLQPILQAEHARDARGD